MRYFGEKVQQAMTEADEKWIVQQMVVIQAPKAFKSIRKSVNELVSVEQIITKEEKIKRKENKIPRAKRKSSRKDNTYKNKSSSDHIT